MMAVLSLAGDRSASDRSASFKRLHPFFPLFQPNARSAPGCDERSSRRTAAWTCSRSDGIDLFQRQAAVLEEFRGCRRARYLPCCKESVYCRSRSPCPPFEQQLSILHADLGRLVRLVEAKKAWLSSACGQRIGSQPMKVAPAAPDQRHQRSPCWPSWLGGRRRPGGHRRAGRRGAVERRLAEEQRLLFHMAWSRHPLRRNNFAIFRRQRGPGGTRSRCSPNSRIAVARGTRRGQVAEDDYAYIDGGEHRPPSAIPLHIYGSTLA